MQEHISGGFSRRAFLGAAGAAALGVPLVGNALGAGHVPAARAAGSTLPVTIVNNSGAYGNDNVYVYVVGTNLTTNVQGHVDPSGTFTPASVGDGAGWGTPLSEAGTVNLPADGMSGRIYLSLGGELPWSVVSTDAGPGIVQPVPWVSGDASYSLLHDFFEFTWQNGALYCNSTQVDMFSVPIGINLVGAQNQTVGLVNDGGRASFFNQMRNTEGFADLVIDDLRVVAPSHGIDVGTFSSTYLDEYIHESWDAYTGTDLTVSANNQTWILRTSGTTLTATQNGATAATFQLPSTRDVLYCDGNLAAPNDGVTGPIAAVLGAALNRSTLRDFASQPTTDASTFYQQSLTNHYAQGLHSIHTDGKSYGFAFDDVAGFASYIEDSAATSCTLTVHGVG